MSRRITIELTSKRGDGSWTWRAAGAREPKGELSSELITFAADVGDELSVEAEFHMDGIEIIEAFAPKSKRPMPETLEVLGSGREAQLVTTQLVAGGKNRERRDRGDRRGRPREDGRGPRDQDDRRERPRREPRPEDDRPKPKRLRPQRTHRQALIDSLPDDQKPIAEQILRDGVDTIERTLRDQRNKARDASKAKKKAAQEKSQSQPEAAEPKADTKDEATEPAAKAEPEADTKPEPEVEIKPEVTEPAAEGDTKIEAAEPSTDTKIEAAEPSTDTKIEAAEPSTDTKIEAAEPAAEADTEPEAKTEGETAVGTAEPTAEAETEPEAKTESETAESAADTKTETTEPEAKTEEAASPDASESEGSAKTEAKADSDKSKKSKKSDKSKTQPADDTNEEFLAVARKLLSRLRAAEWQDRAEAALAGVEEVDLRDLRSVVVAAETGAVDDEAKAMATDLRTKLTNRVDREHTEWLAEVAATLADGRMVRALRLSSRPPKAGSPLPQDMATRLTEAANSALTSETPPKRWTTVLGAVAFSPVRQAVQPQGIPEKPGDELLTEVKKLANRVPTIAAMFGVEASPPPRRSRQRSKR